MIKLIALDLDGTLMSEDHITVSEGNKKALRMAREAGARIAVSTGRTLSIIGNIAEQVPEIDYIIYSNGTAVFDRANNKRIYENAMPWETGKRILKYLDQFPVFSEIYSGGNSYAQEDRLRYFPQDIFPREFVDEAIKGMVFCGSAAETLQGKSIEKFTVYVFDGKLYKEIWDFFSSSDDFAVTSSFPGSIDITKKDADKGAALKNMCELLGITAGECMAFGDAANDIPMLSFAKYGFAMENASEPCKAAAKYHTGSNAEDGVAQGICRIMFPGTEP